VRVFLTGGSGLLGSHTAERLRRGGHHVVALVRADTDTCFLERLGCTLVEGDVRDDPDHLAPLVAGCTHVLHGAALVYTGGGWPKIRAANVDGTRNVLTAAARAGVGHAVHVSSVAAYGAVDGPVDERTPIDSPLPPSDLYARSKRESEAAARKVEAELGLPVTILRPAAVYGERDRLMAVRVERLLRYPVAFVLGGGKHTLPAVYAGNVAAAAVLALEAGRGGTTYDVAFDRPLTQRMLMEGLARGLGRSPILISIPAALARAGAAILQRFGVSAPGAQGLPMARVVRMALADNPFASERIRSELGWDPDMEHEAALERTGRWLAGQSEEERDG
jgi:nucleoside-diphosphate-sugar epimerase